MSIRSKPLTAWQLEAITAGVRLLLKEGRIDWQSGEPLLKMLESAKIVRVIAPVVA
jgi:hypothetical protein